MIYVIFNFAIAISIQAKDNDAVRSITFDRPDTRNAVTAEVTRDLIAGLDDLDPSRIDAVVITGEGDAFSAGGDIQAMANRSETAKEAYDRVRATLEKLQSNYDKPRELRP